MGRLKMAIKITTFVSAMKKIGLISDTHGVWDDALRCFLDGVDEIWHAGDFGNLETYQAIASFKPLRAVYGNIDGAELRGRIKGITKFTCEAKRVMMTHIGGYPKRYDARIEPMLDTERPDIFIAGHSHILRVMYDKRHDLLYMNPGAAGLYGFHKVRTALRFEIDGTEVRKMELGEWPKQTFQQKEK